MDMQGDYRLFRQGGGRGAFAHVYVLVTAQNQIDDRIVVAVNATDTATTTPERDPDWFAAAIQGCRDASRALQAQGTTTETYQIQITRLLSNLVDTCPDAVRAAAFMATVEAFGKEDDFRLVFQGEWSVIPQS